MASLVHADPVDRSAPRRTDRPASQESPAASDLETRRVIDLLRRTLDRLPE